jgi:hypothetical protein
LILDIVVAVDDDGFRAVVAAASVRPATGDGLRWLPLWFVFV